MRWKLGFDRPNWTGSLNMVIIDYSGIAISNVLVMNVDLNENMIRHMILNSLRMYNLKYRMKYGKMVIACDGGSKWRKEIFPNYKANRAKGKEENKFDWKELYRIIDMVQDEIRDHLPYTVIQIPGLEADDIIATLVESTQEFGKSEPVMIISSDKDFIQLQRFKNVAQFSPMKKKLVAESNPVRFLQEHVLRGDGGDGVPNVLSADDTFVSGARQTPLSSKKIDAWIAAYDNLESVMDEQTYKNFLRNRALIDMSQIPQDKKDLIMKTFESIPETQSNILTYLVSKRCSQLIGCAEEFLPYERPTTYF